MRRRWRVKRAPLVFPREDGSRAHVWVAFDRRYGLGFSFRTWREAFDFAAGGGRL